MYGSNMYMRPEYPSRPASVGRGAGKVCCDVSRRGYDDDPETTHPTSLARLPAAVGRSAGSENTQLTTVRTVPSVVDVTLDHIYAEGYTFLLTSSSCTLRLVSYYGHRRRSMGILRGNDDCKICSRYAHIFHPFSAFFSQLMYVQ